MSWAEDEGYDAYDGDDYLGIVGIKQSPKSDRIEATWATKDNRILKVTTMDDNHLFNAYMMSGKESLFKEMVYRLFEAREKNNG
jgi:hypothetical protein